MPDPEGRIKVSIDYVRKLTHPFGENKRLASADQLNSTDISVFYHLVDMFAADIEGRQIPHDQFFDEVVGAAALRGIEFTEPTSPGNLKIFANEVAPYVEEFHFERQNQLN